MIGVEHIVMFLRELAMTDPKNIAFEFHGGIVPRVIVAQKLQVAGGGVSDGEHDRRNWTEVREKLPKIGAETIFGIVVRHFYTKNDVTIKYDYFIFLWCDIFFLLFLQ